MKTNKLRNTFLAASFCLLNTISYGQTKEETISWLKVKLSNYLETRDASLKDIKLESINECEFVVTYNFPYYYETTKIIEKFRTTFPTADIIIDVKAGKIKYKNAVIKSLKDNKIFYSKDELHISLRNGENDIYTRIQKALDHLATFCPKKSETF